MFLALPARLLRMIDAIPPLTLANNTHPSLTDARITTSGNNTEKIRHGRSFNVQNLLFIPCFISFYPPFFAFHYHSSPSLYLCLSATILIDESASSGRGPPESVQRAYSWHHELLMRLQLR